MGVIHKRACWSPFPLAPKCGTVAGVKPTSGLGLLVFAGLVAAAWVAGCAGHTAKADPVVFRVMTYNIHHGEGADGVIDLARIATVIRRERADLVALQEVDRGVERTARRDLPAELATLTGMTCVFSNNFHYQGGEYGNAVLTRFPVRTWTNTHLRMLRAGEQRGLLQVTVSVQGRDLDFWNTHIDFRRDDAERLQNVAEFKAMLARQRRGPLVLCGDFNDTPGSRVYQAMIGAFDDAWALAGQGDGFTITSRQPAKRIDYVWLRKGLALKPVKAWVPETLASDHLPLVVEFVWQ